jgi:nicotinamide-nucleotide amidase
VRIAVLSIGDELLWGEIVDTNFARIAARCYDVGLPVTAHRTVGDDEAAIAAALGELAAGADALIVTGGLGPTSDDLTAAAAAKASGVELERNEAALAHVRHMAGRFGGDLPPANEKQALIPTGAVLIDNPLGTACGFSFDLAGCRCFFLPGVPREMERMLEESVLPEILALRRSPLVCRTLVFTVFGPSEAELGTRLEGALPGGRGVTIAYCVSFPEILVKLRATGTSETGVAAALDTAVSIVRPLLGEDLVAEGEEGLDAVLARLLKERGVTLALAESCTGGLLAGRITAVAGSSAYFLEGAVTYANAAKVRVLGVPEPLLAEKGAVSPETAEAMAAGMRRAAGSDLALAVTGIAGPDGGTPDKPVGTVYIALADSGGCLVRHCLFRGSREEIRTITAYTALDWLRRRLLVQ